MSDNPTVYLAGPEVFFPEDVRIHIDGSKKAVLAEFGFEGLAPFDNALDLEHAEDPAQLIYDANQALMDQATALIANLTPFRGPSADAGTIYELGYMIAKGKPSVGFSVCGVPYNKRVDGRSDVDGNGAAIEPFGLCDNLMLDCGLARNGGTLVHWDRSFPETGYAPEDFFDEAVFRSAVRHLYSQISGVVS